MAVLHIVHQASGCSIVRQQGALRYAFCRRKHDYIKSIRLCDARHPNLAMHWHATAARWPHCNAWTSTERVPTRLPEAERRGLSQQACPSTFNLTGCQSRVQGAVGLKPLAILLGRWGSALLCDPTGAQNAHSTSVATQCRGMRCMRTFMTTISERSCLHSCRASAAPATLQLAANQL